MKRDLDLFNSDTPKSLGFTMPAEWHRHQCCWMSWPDNPRLWRDLGATQRAYTDVAQAIARFEPVNMVVNETSRQTAERLCGSNIELLNLPINESWMRDNGPTFVRHPDGRVAGVDWRFNAWGGKSLPYDKDAALAERLLEHLALPVYKSPYRQWRYRDAEVRYRR